MKKKGKNALPYILAVTVTVILSISALHSNASPSFLYRADSENRYYRASDALILADIKLDWLNKTNSSYITAIITSFMNSLKLFSSPGISATSFDEADSVNKISTGGVASAPEPVTLLLLGTGLMGIAFYRRFRNR
ncbi:MAG: PEP-CTERM sorting domain-containing protein [Nitrospiraceae bacterium]|nr:MAG: PEP-CTERM sorting domain-containing protein [Nitrospiraceae bacterium]